MYFFSSHSSKQCIRKLRESGFGCFTSQEDVDQPAESNEIQLGVVAENDDEFERIETLIPKFGGRILKVQVFGSYYQGCCNWVLNLLFPDEQSAIAAKLALA